MMRGLMVMRSGWPSVFHLDEMEKTYGEHAKVNMMREIYELAQLATD